MYEPKFDNKLTGIFVVNIISILILLFFPFGGLYSYDGYNKIRTWTYLRLFQSFETFIVIAAIIACFVYTLYKAYLLRENKLDNNGLKTTFTVSIVTISLIVLAAIIVAIVGASYDDWWLDTGFYGSLIGAIISFVLFKLLSDTITNEGIELSVQGVSSGSNSKTQKSMSNQKSKKQTTMYCPACGSKVTGTSFCQDCGTKL